MPRTYTAKQKAAIWAWYKQNPNAQKARDQRRHQAWERANMEVARIKEGDTNNKYRNMDNATDKIFHNILDNLDEEDFLNDNENDDIDTLVLNAYEDFIKTNPNELPMLTDKDVEEGLSSGKRKSTEQEDNQPKQPPKKQRPLTEQEGIQKKQPAKKEQPAPNIEKPGTSKQQQPEIPAASSSSTSSEVNAKKSILEFKNYNKNVDIKLLLQIIQLHYIYKLDVHVLENNIYLIHSTILKDTKKFQKFIPKYFESVNIYHIEKCLKIEQLKTYLNALDAL